MNELFDYEAGFEPERYELDAAPPYRFELLRRDFFKLVGAGAVVASVLARGTTAQDPRRRRGGRPQLPQDIGAWLHIDEDGKVTAYTGKAEVGQDIRTSLAQAVADELRVPLERVRVVMADTARTPYDRGTFGSQSTPVMAAQLRRVAATARELLARQAAADWQVAASEVVAEAGTIRHGASGREASFGTLTRGKKLLETVAAETETTSPENWTVAGKSASKVDGRAMVTGAHRYSTDQQRPKMLHGKVLRSPSFGAELITCDASAAEAMSGVTVVIDGNFVAVAAQDKAMAESALTKIRAEWKDVEQVSDRELFEHLVESAGEGSSGGRGNFQQGSIDEGLAAGEYQFEARYTCAYIAHAPLEPRAALAEWQDGSLQVWTGTQRPFGVRSELAEALRLPEEKVRVIVPDTGSGYGGKHNGEAAIEAARLAKAAGRPVKVVWTREEEFTWAYFRPAGVMTMRSAVDAEGRLTAWEYHNYNSGTSSIRTLYDVPNQSIQFHRSRSPLRQGSYRGLAAAANHFARECHMDEIANALDMDPLEFRLLNLSDERFRGVLQAAAERFGWGQRKAAEGVGFGIAGGFEKRGYVASCAEVAMQDGVPLVKRVVTAFDCGAVVNPDGLENQITGSVIMGLGGALFESIGFQNGRIRNPRFSQYRVPRFADVPELETVLVDRKDLPSAGGGETPIVAVAPAVGNAIFAACGERRRGLPMG
jgi:isoquinoline 1-oxidoreductase